MNIDNERRKVLDELSRQLAPDSAGDEGPAYRFRQYMINGRRFSTLENLRYRQFRINTPEETTVVDFAKMLSESTDSSLKEFSRTVRNILWLHQSGEDPIRETPVYLIAKEYSDKTLATRPKSVERDFILMTAVEKIKSAYRALVEQKRSED